MFEPVPSHMISQPGFFLYDSVTVTLWRMEGFASGNWLGHQEGIVVDRSIERDLVPAL